MVDLSNNRMSYHLSMRDIVPARIKKFRDIYSLIDVLFYRSRNTDDWYYSGFTLQTIKSEMKSWSDEDYESFRSWVMVEDGFDFLKQSMEKARKYSNTPKIMPLRNEDIFHSSLLAKIETVSMGKASPQQWAGTIRNMTKQGIRKEEIACSGLLLWLDEQSGSVCKQELLKHTCFDDIQVRLVTEIGTRKNPDLNFIEWHRDVNPRKDRWIGNDILSAYVQYRDKAFGYQIARVERDDLFGRYGYWFLLDYRNRPVRCPRERENVLMSDGYSTPEDAMDAAHDDLSEKFSSFHWRAEGKRWQYETLYGGENYCEWLLILPNYQEDFYSDHFSVRNIVAHVRTKVREDANGGQWLFLEEVQSDWCQSGRRLGYIGQTGEGKVPYVPFANSWHELAIKAMFYIASEMDLDGIAWTTGAQQIKRWSRYPSLDTDGLSVFYDQIIPRFMKRFGKRLGARLEAASFVTGDQSCYACEADGGWIVKSCSGEQISGVFKHRNVAEDLAARKQDATAEECPLLLMPDAMKAHIRQHGVPLFGLCQ